MDTINRTCRLCLKAIGSLFLLDKNGGDVQYAAKIMRWTSIIITEDDGLPSLICIDCANLLKTTDEFLNLCEASDRALRSELTVKREVKVEYEAYTGLLKHEEDFSCDLPSIPSSYQDQSPKAEKPLPKLKKKGLKKIKTGPIQCTICGILVNCPSALQIHIRSHTGERPFLCSQCDRSYKSQGALTRHAQARHLPRERRFTCETCGASFYRKNEIIQHLRRHTGERPHVCPFCARRFLQISSLIRHKRTHTGDKPYHCPQCSKAFPDRSSLTKHSTVHSTERNHRCHLCHKPFKTRSSLRAHITNIHSSGGIMCNFCGATFSVKGNLTVHIQRIHSEKSGQCMVCSKPFSNLEEHMRVHSGEKPFICDLCNKGFHKKKSLANHWVFKHGNADKYKCSLAGCPRSFPTASMLQFHLLKQHTRHTPHVCQHCARGFYRVCDLSRHLRVTHMCMRTERGDVKPDFKLHLTSATSVPTVGVDCNG